MRQSNLRMLVIELVRIESANRFQIRSRIYQSGEASKYDQDVNMKIYDFQQTIDDVKNLSTNSHDQRVHNRGNKSAHGIQMSGLDAVGEGLMHAFD